MWLAGWPSPRQSEEGAGWAWQGRKAGQRGTPGAGARRQHRRVPTRTATLVPPAGGSPRKARGLGQRATVPATLLPAHNFLSFWQNAFANKKTSLGRPSGHRRSAAPVRRPAMSFPTTTSHTPAARQPLRELRDPSSHPETPPPGPRTHQPREPEKPSLGGNCSAIAQEDPEAEPVALSP